MFVTGGIMENLETLKALLKSHDWFYFYSDDQRVWSNGDDNEKRIKALLKETGQDGKDLYNEMKPSTFDKV